MGYVISQSSLFLPEYPDLKLGAQQAVLLLGAKLD